MIHADTPMLIFTSSDSSLDLWQSREEFQDTDIEVKCYQKISKGVHVPRGKFGIMLETVHTSKNGADKSCIIERVSVKMVAKDEDRMIRTIKFKPIEDGFMEEQENKRTNLFVLSSNQVERLQWSIMEIAVIIDRRPKCHIKGISEEIFATTVCSAPTMAYLEKAQSFR